jgi:hypothetical protein
MAETIYRPSLIFRRNVKPEDITAAGVASISASATDRVPVPDTALNLDSISDQTGP